MNMRERLRGIPDLILSKRLLMMSNSQLDAYVVLLHSFVEKYPAYEAKVKTAMEKRDVKSITMHLTNIREMLKKIHADELADECWKRLNGFDEERPDKIEAYVSFLLSTLTALSIDIQVAFYRDDDENLSSQSSKPSTSPQREGSRVNTKEDNTIKSILAVDDDAYSLDAFKAALKNVPCKIIGATSGLSALSVLNKLKPDLFVLDIEMPGMNGIELAAEIRSQGHDAPIIFITGKSTKEYVQKCMQAGASDFIVKPINPQDAVNRIQKFL